jgi:hypothetical protein
MRTQTGDVSRHYVAYRDFSQLGRRWPYMRATGLEAGSRAPLFQSAPRRSRALSGQALDRGAILRIVKRRCAPLGLALE